MCHVCSLERISRGKLAGAKGRISQRKLYRAYTNAVANLKLCYVHDIELHVMGEERFLRAHPKLAKDLAQNSNKYAGASKSDGMF